MKPGTLTCVTTITLFAALAAPIQLAAQEQNKPQPALAVPLQLAAQEQQPNKQQPRYRLVDIGTFGGPESYINPPFSLGSPNQINRRGTAVGASATSIPTTSVSDPAICGGIDGLVPFVNHAFEWQNGVITDLGSLSGPGNCSVATAVNANGEAVGQSEISVIDPLFGFNELRAVVWQNGHITDLGTFGGAHSIGVDINSRGQVVGLALNTIPDPFSLLDFGIGGSSNGTQTRAFLWEGSSLQDLGTLGGNDAQAGLVNELGQVAGFSYTNTTPNPTTGIPTLDPFLWDHNTMTDLGTLGGTNGGPTALNNRGQVIGSSNLAGDQTSHPFLWSQEKLIDLYNNTTGGNPLTADAINDGGEIVGAAAFPTQAYDAYLRRAGVATDLGHLNGDCNSEALAINSAGRIAGTSFSCDGVTQRAFLWQNGWLVDLNSLIPPGSSLQLVWPMAINDRGEIAGLGVPSGCAPTDVNTCGHGFVLIPCGEGEKGCGGSAASPAATTQNNPGSATARSTTTTPANPAVSGRPATVLDRLRSRWGQRYRVPGPTN